MKKFNWLWLSIIFIVLLSAYKKSGTRMPANGNANPNFRVVGYLRDNNVSDGSVANFDFSRINYLNIAFINPDQDGNFSALAGLNTVVTAAHAKKVKVLVSLGGGLAPAYYSSLLADDKRNNLINNIIKLVSDNNLDGADVDLEGERIDNNYESFVTTLSIALKAKGKILTAAVATAYKSKYTDKALAQFDFINIMSYDKTGPWNPSNPGQHAPYNMAVSDLDYWTTARGIDKEKLSLGMPFYGYGFGTNAPAYMSFGNIVSQYPGAENMDQVTVSGGGIVYYNGIPTIKSKTTLALKKSGGIMVWQLLQDANGSNSLLNTINATINSAGR